MIVHTTAPMLRTLLRVDQENRPFQCAQSEAVRNNHEFAVPADNVSNDRTALVRRSKV